MTDEYELPVGIELAPTQTMQPKMTRILQRKGDTFELYLQIPGLYTKLEILQLVRCIPSNRLRRMLGFHDRFSSRFSLAACLWRLALAFIGFYRVTCTWTHYMKSRSDDVQHAACWFPRCARYTASFSWQVRRYWVNTYISWLAQSVRQLLLKMEITNALRTRSRFNVNARTWRAKIGVV